jgi:hypothetical protein
MGFHHGAADYAARYGRELCLLHVQQGRIRCVNGLLRTYGTRVKAKGEAAGLPIVELQSDSYKHRTYGKIFFPVLHVVGWTDPATGAPQTTTQELDDDLPDALKG